MKKFISFPRICLLALTFLGFSCSTDDDKSSIGNPVADFSFAADTENPLMLSFTNNSENATLYSWDFGYTDMVTSVVSPVHTFPEPGSYEVTLTASNGTSVNKKTEVIVVEAREPDPTVSSVEPSEAMVGEAVTITGIDFGSDESAVAVTFSGTEASIISFSDTEIKVTVPDVVTGDLVVTIGEEVIYSDIFNIVEKPQPTVTNVEPGEAMVGETVTITGTDFGSDESAVVVSFSGTEASITSFSDTEIQVTVPNVDSGNLVVTVEGVEIYTENFNITEPQQPTVTSVEPGEAMVGETVTITGTDFGSDETAVAVTLSGTEASIISFSDTEIQITVPDVASGELKVFVDENEIYSGSFVVIDEQSTSCTGDETYEEILAGCGESKAWVLDGAGSIMIGPAAGGTWWELPEEQLDGRTCQLNDQFVFHSDGTFVYDSQGDIYVEEEGGAVHPSDIGLSIGCNDEEDLTAPYDAWGSGTHSFVVNGEELTVNGTGAFLGIYKAGENDFAVEPEESITYEIVELTPEKLTITATLPDRGARYRFIFAPVED